MLYSSLGIHVSQTLRELFVISENLRDIDYLEQALSLLNTLNPPKNIEERMPWEIDHTKALADICKYFSLIHTQLITVPGLSDLEARTESSEELKFRYAEV